jgi:glycosyltransferase involved in cell wall biosynthesis
MPVFNGEQYLQQAIDSILVQTFSDFELIIINDGSTDGTKAILDSYQDNRMRILQFVNNEGISRRINTGLVMAAGQYIARMDADDISLPTRFEKQVGFLEEHPEIGICGTWAELIGTATGVIWKYPTDSGAIYARMLFNSTIVHSSVMMRADAIHQYNLRFELDFPGFEDYEFWSRALPVMRFANLPEVLVQYRLHSSSISHTEKQNIQEGVRAVVYPRLLRNLGINYSESDLYLHQQIGLYNYGKDVEFLQRARRWLEKLARANQKAKVLPQKVLLEELGERWTQVCQNSRAQPGALIANILLSPLPFRGSSSFRKIWRAFRFWGGRLRYSPAHRI